METWTLRGQVLAEGAPASGARVAVFQFPPKGSQVSRKADLHFNARCDAKGRFLVDGLRPGMASVSVMLNGYVWGHSRAESPGEESVVIRLERGASIRGRVNWQGPECRPEVSITLESDFGAWETWVRIGHDFDFDFDGLPPGLYRVTVDEDVELLGPREVRVEPATHDLSLKLRAR